MERKEASSLEKPCTDKVKSELENERAEVVKPKHVKPHNGRIRSSCANFRTKENKPRREESNTNTKKDAWQALLSRKGDPRCEK